MPPFVNETGPFDHDVEIDPHGYDDTFAGYIRHEQAEDDEEFLFHETQSQPLPDEIQGYKDKLYDGCLHFAIHVCIILFIKMFVFV